MPFDALCRILFGIADHDGDFRAARREGCRKCSEGFGKIAVLRERVVMLLEHLMMEHGDSVN